jgi:hypothetical protein
MNYLLELNKFDDWHEINPELSKSAIALWHALMSINNRADWAVWFTVAMSTLEFRTGFRRSELFKARNELMQLGRIEWQTRNGRSSANYRIIPFCIHNTDANRDANRDANSDHYKTKQNKTKQKERKEINKEKYDFRFLEKGYEKIFTEWLEYKVSRKEGYKTQKSLEICYNHIKKLSNNSPEIAQQIIEQSIGNNWAGLFSLKKEKSVVDAFPVPKSKLEQNAENLARTLDKINRGEI